MRDLVQQLCLQIKAAKSPVSIRGGGTKSALIATCETNGTQIALDALPAGILRYDPAEFLITACAGTPISELQSALAEQGQYLPCDPLFQEQGATLGGTIAAGISGPNQLLYGRLRDFVMEIECVDGTGECVRGGCKVVKNAAGFDLPKLMVGSYGRLGLITEATLKVLPRPQAARTVKLVYDSLPDALAAAEKIASQPLTLAATELLPGGELYVRFAGPDASLPRILKRTAELLQHDFSEVQDEQQWRQVEQRLTTDQDRSLWRCVHRANYLPALVEESTAIPGVTFHSAWSLGSESWWTLDRGADLGSWHESLGRHGAEAVRVRGGGRGLGLVGSLKWLSFARRICEAVDPGGVFGGFPAEPLHVKTETIP